MLIQICVDEKASIIWSKNQISIMMKKENSISIFFRLHITYDPYFLRLKVKLILKTQTNNICAT